MKEYTLGKTGITVPQNAFGALPIQRVSTEEAAHLLRRASLQMSSLLESLQGALRIKE